MLLASFCLELENELKVIPRVWEFIGVMPSGCFNYSRPSGGAILLWSSTLINISTNSTNEAYKCLPESSSSTWIIIDRANDIWTSSIWQRSLIIPPQSFISFMNSLKSKELWAFFTLFLMPPYLLYKFSNIGLAALSVLSNYKFQKCFFLNCC